MNKVDIVTGAAAPLLRANLDTDTVIRIERLTQQPRDALGQYAFEALRRRADGSEDPDFVLNRQAYRAAPILLAGANFGCGSSREGAVWALFEAGIRCVIAESFGEIFYGNCFQNGMLPVRLDAQRIAQLAALSEAGEPVTVSLIDCAISAGSVCFAFEIDPLRRDALMAGLDEITQTFAYREQIADWQTADRERRPWVWIPLERQSA